jgi:hypothetical protein
VQNSVATATNDTKERRAAANEMMMRRCCVSGPPAPVDSVDAELRGLKLTQLRQRATAGGAPAERVEEAEDSDEPRSALIDLIREHEREPPEIAQLRSELARLKRSELKRRALAANVDEARLEQAEDMEEAAEARALIIEMVCLRAAQDASPTPDPASASRAELVGLKLSELKRRARSAGVSEAGLDEAVDSADDDPRAAVIELIVAASGAGDRPTERPAEQQAAALRSELQGLRLKDLRKRARDAGIDGQLLEEAADADDPKSAVIELLVSQSKPPVADEMKGNAALQTELESLRLKELRARAKAAGVSADDLEDAADSDDPKASVILLLLAHESTRAAGDVPHFGSGGGGSSSQQAHDTRPKPPRSGIFPASKHAMISYQWADQELVVAARKALTQHGVPCWMDIDGGMKQDIYESMADGVSNASVVVCFMSQKYQDSENCKLELKFAKQSGVPIVPVLVEGDGWKPSAWLGLITAGALWTPLRDESKLEGTIHGLVEQIKGAVPGSGDAASDDESEEELDVDGGAETRAELERLRKQIESRDIKPTINEAAPLDTNAPAVVSAGVPELPPDYGSTAEVRKLKQNLLHSTTQPKIGFWGMGGIGKTVTSAALVRDADVRIHFDQIIWVPLGQAPVMEKLQSSALQQLVGKPMDSTFTEEERHAALREAFKGKRVLLALDDLWEEEHSLQFNFVDEACGSRVLISTRIRHLLSDAFSVEIGKPSVEDSIKILTGAAKLGDGANVPAEATEIVELCGRLPLALVMAGKLILELQVGSKWDGITSILRDELRGNEQASSHEQGVIRASLAGLGGSKRDTTGARQLFKLFGLVPEDTSCPLECLQLMYDAVYETSKATSVLHIRKWLRMLIDRSLVLGTVDRASLHDLVLDFTIGMHSKAELVSAHRRVVEMFRANRPTNAAGVSEWSSVNRDDAMTAYVLADGAHHVRAAQSGLAHSDEMLLDCLTDIPQDCIVLHVSLVLGERAIEAAAEAAEAAGEMWLAGCRWAALSHLMHHSKGQMAVVRPLQRAAKALAKVRLSSRASSLSVRQKDELELRVINNLLLHDISATNNSEEMKPRIERLLRTDTAAVHVDVVYGMLLGSALPVLVATTDVEVMVNHGLDQLEFLVRAGCTSHPDPAMRALCFGILRYHMHTYTDLFAMSIGNETMKRQFDWELLGEGGEHLLKAFEL